MSCRGTIWKICLPVLFVACETYVSVKSIYALSGFFLGRIFDTTRAGTFSTSLPCPGWHTVSTAKSFSGRVSPATLRCLCYLPLQPGPISAGFGPYKEIEMGVVGRATPTHYWWVIWSQESRPGVTSMAVQGAGGGRNGTWSHSKFGHSLVFKS